MLNIFRLVSSQLNGLKYFNEFDKFIVAVKEARKFRLHTSVLKKTDKAVAYCSLNAHGMIFLTYTHLLEALQNSRRFVDTHFISLLD